ncbi:unnamed protein product [Cuscuta campestris]|uniref:Uncharacterized protein n=1 Tax=Cuscuta campestris TaxID=132261 RepID=A0A484NLK2_9ASTE|nr:unnamed protein product [Cuscuta campestris]
MALMFSPKSILSCFYPARLHNNHNTLSAIVERRNPIIQVRELPLGLKLAVRTHSFPPIDDENGSDFDWGEIELGIEEEEEESPWEGAVVYGRNPSVSHLEYCTTLERLGLGKLSTEVSRSRASLMGIRVTKDVTDYPEGTPVLVSLEATIKQRKIRLDGIIRTVITLGCNRCGEPAAVSVFSNFSLLLSEEPPVEEPETLDMGIIIGSKKSGSIEDREDDDSLIDIEDQLHFPAEKRSIDISKHIRDRVHLEITLNAICDPQCKGLCLKCGTNLNIRSCKCCDKRNPEGKGFGARGHLAKKMQRMEKS